MTEATTSPDESILVGRNIVIFGSPGSGKSTLARLLAQRFTLRPIHFDQIYWMPGWRVRPAEELPALVEAAVAGDGWVFDGNNSLTMPIRLARADTVIWLDLPRTLCLFRVVKRIAASYGRVRGDMAAGCPERFDPAFLRWTWEFPRHSRPAQARLFETATQPFRHRLTSRRAVSRFLTNVGCSKS